MPTISLWAFATSMPTAGFPGMGASIRTPPAARFRAMSSARLVILAIFTPAEGCTSYRVTVGPRLMPVIRTCTPKLLSVSTRISAFCRSSSAALGSAALLTLGSR